MADYKDPYTFLTILKSGDGHKYGKYSNKQVDELLDKSTVEADPAKRFEYMSQAEDILMQDYRDACVDALRLQ